MAVFLFWLRENGRGILIAAPVIALIFALSLLPVWREASPIVEIAQVEGKIASFVSTPMSPEYAVGRGFSYNYRIELADTGSVVTASDDDSRPHAIGSSVKLERLLRANGRISYRFPL